MHYSVSFLVLQSTLRERERERERELFVLLLLSYRCLASVNVLSLFINVPFGWSAVCDCCIS